jgi:hypothetical protein
MYYATCNTFFLIKYKDEKSIEESGMGAGAATD